MNFILVHSVCSHLGTVEICHSKRLHVHIHQLAQSICRVLCPYKTLSRTAKDCTGEMAQSSRSLFGKHETLSYLHSAHYKVRCSGAHMGS